MADDLRRLGHGPALPAEVRVTFPARLRLGIGCGAPTRYDVAVGVDEALAHRAAQTPPEYGVHPGHKRFRSSAPAIFDDPEEEPANAEQLLFLARTIARDYYRWRLYRRDVSYPGTVDLPSTGIEGWISWTYRHDGAETRVVPTPYDVEPEGLLHGLPCLEADGGSSSSSSAGEPEGCGGRIPPDYDRLDDMVWVWFPADGIKGATMEGRSVVPGGSSCEVMVEGDDGVLCPSGVFRDVYHYWSSDVGGDRLGRAVCWRGRLVTVGEDCGS